MRYFSENEPVYLTHTYGGHHKFYDMIPDVENNVWVAVWGKINTYGQMKIYSANEWSKKLDEKLNKGYDIVDFSYGNYNRDEVIRMMKE